MPQGYTFREVRKGERADVLSFALSQGLPAEHVDLRHNLSLTLQSEGEMVAAALCLNDTKDRLIVEIVTNGDALDPELINELANRCLAKVQSEAIGSARMHSPAQEPAETILSQANWLDQIQETPPPNAEPVAEPDAPVDAAAQAA